jgi:hypothetical protein
MATRQDNSTQTIQQTSVTTMATISTQDSDNTTGTGSVSDHDHGIEDYLKVELEALKEEDDGLMQEEQEMAQAAAVPPNLQSTTTPMIFVHKEDVTPDTYIKRLSDQELGEVGASIQSIREDLRNPHLDPTNVTDDQKLSLLWIRARLCCEFCEGDDRKEELSNLMRCEMKMTQYMSVFGDNILARTKEVLRIALRQIFRHNKIAASVLDSDNPFPFLSDKLDDRLIQNHQLASSFVTRSVHKTVIG